MNDHLGIFDPDDDDDDHDEPDPATGEVDLADLRDALARAPEVPATRSRDVGRQDRRVRLATERQRRSRRRRSSLIAVLVLAVIATAVVVGFKIWRTNVDAVPDYAGSGDTEVVVRVASGDSLDDIGATLQSHDVIASAAAFVTASASDTEIRSLQPGYFKIRQHASVAAAADALVDPAGRVGRVRLNPGRQLADVTVVNKSGTSVLPGYISQLTAAACVPLNGQRHCFTAEQLWQVEQTARPSDLGVVEWATDGVNRAPEPGKRLEGLLVPGDYDVPPNGSPLEVLRQVMSASAALWNKSSILADSADAGQPPYALAIIASIVEREGGNAADMPKVARVVYNRLARNQKLQMDSTLNSALNRSQIQTTSGDLQNQSVYNTYAHAGLPPTPIASAGPTAIEATLQPAAGDWLFFVKIDLAGNSCFSVTEAEHTRCVAEAKKNGVFG